MKKKKFLVYLAAMLLPTLIFVVCAFINGYVPFGTEMLNSYDSFTQYSGMILEYARLLGDGNLFYSFGAGLGFNFFGTLTYYAMSPLNLLGVLATAENYHIFIAFMTFLRFALLGGAMCFYLDSKKLKPWQVILFSTIYALMGYTSTYYYNFLWIDSVIMLPFVMYGLDRLLEGKSPTFYIVSLIITIFINYYIGYMICIFSLVWFLYNLIGVKDKKKVAKTFFISSGLAGLTTAVVIFPSFFALMTGKAELYKTIDYIGINRNAFTFFYTFTAGAYQTSEQTYGPALIYCTIFVFVLAIFYFFNKKFSKKEKMATLAVIAFFYLSFSVKFINYAWQFFQQPIWWQSRFSFVFSFFLITLAYKSLNALEKIDFKTKYRVIIAGIFAIALAVGAVFKWKVLPEVEVFSYIFLGFSFLLFLEEIFLLDKKGFLPMIVVFTFIELSLNTYNSLKMNYKDLSITNYAYIKEEVPDIVKELNAKNEYFYRMELIENYTSDDGLYFGYNGVNYFNSVRNMSVLKLVENLGIAVLSSAHIQLDSFDPVVMSLLNVKYLYGQSMGYYDKIDNRLYENPYPLSLAFMTKSDILDLTMDKSTPYENKNSIVKSMTGLDHDLYKIVHLENFEAGIDKDTTDYKYSFKSDRNYLILPNLDGEITINGETKSVSKKLNFEIEKDDEVEILYTVSNYKEDVEKQVLLALLDIEAFEEHMKSLSEEVALVKSYKDGHIASMEVTSSGKYDYLYTSIGYERGMKVYVDGKEVTPDITLGALIGLPLGEGHHEIVIDYVPRGLVPGAIISGVSLVLVVVYLQMRKKVI